MDDDVADRLERMKLTIEEEEIISISDEGRLDAIESCNPSLIGKFLTCHDLKHCAAHYAVEKQGGQVEYQYGDFLNAAGSRPRAPTSKNTNPMSHTKEGNGSAAKQSSSYFVNQGMDSENVHGNNAQYKCHANVKELNAEIRELGPENMLIGQSNTEINAGVDNGLDRINHNEGQ
uniref:Uncharacterized protein n=1 Tax=Quercus lobata TaxID=97700 RepID=A0A7N2REM5_QUELO